MKAFKADKSFANLGQNISFIDMAVEVVEGEKDDFRIILIDN